MTGQPYTICAMPAGACSRDENNNLFQVQADMPMSAVYQLGFRFLDAQIKEERQASQTKSAFDVLMQCCKKYDKMPPERNPITAKDKMYNDVRSTLQRIGVGFTANQVSNLGKRVVGDIVERPSDTMCDYNHLRSPSIQPVGIIDHVSSLSNNLGELIENSDYSDITLVVESRKFQAHKVILAARSDYFRAMLYGGLMESQPGTSEVQLQDTSAKAFECLLKYIYTGKMNLIEIKEEHLLEVLGMAHRYGFTELETAISDYLKAVLNIRNVCLVYDLASIYSLRSLCDVCMEFMDRNASHILQSDAFLQLSQQSVKQLISRDSFCAPEIEIFSSIRAWAAENDGEDPTPILGEVRLPLMSKQELLHAVRDTSLVSADIILDAITLQSESRDMELKYRGFMTPEENVATTRHGAQVIRGEMKAALLDGDTINYDLDRGFTRHLIDDNHGQGIVIKLAQPYILNTIKMLLWDRDQRSYSYYLEVSMDDKDYERVVDYQKYWCRSEQTVHFPAKVVRYIRVVGTHNTQNRVFHLVSVECLYTTKPFILEQGLIVPTENVATIARKACVIEGVSRSRNALINGDTRQYDWDSGYTCHQLGSGCIIVQLPQPYLLSSIRLLLWDCDDRSYCFYIETSVDNTNWTIVCDKRHEPSKSWQNISFSKRPVAFIKIVGTHNTANEVFHCVHFETPSQAVRQVPSCPSPNPNNNSATTTNTNTTPMGATGNMGNTASLSPSPIVVHGDSLRPHSASSSNNSRSLSQGSSSGNNPGPSGVTQGLSPAPGGSGSGRSGGATGGGGGQFLGMCMDQDMFAAASMDVNLSRDVSRDVASPQSVHESQDSVKEDSLSDTSETEER